MPFNLPDFPWTTWVIIGAAGIVLALFISGFSKERRAAGFVAFAITMAAAVCGAIGLIEWLRGH